jgi:hypothetical protein
LMELGLKPSAVTKMSERPSDAGAERVSGGALVSLRSSFG